MTGRECRYAWRMILLSLADEVPMFSIYSISCLNSSNIDITLDWLRKRA